MHRRQFVLLRISALALAVPGVAVAEPRPADRGGARSFKLDLRFGEDPFIDVGASGPSLGDLRVLDDRLFRGNRQVGRDGGSCVVTNASRPEAACSLTFRLPRGTIAGQWLNQPPRRKVVAVTGGTGLYRGARGDVIVFEQSSSRGTATFRLLSAPNRL